MSTAIATASGAPSIDAGVHGSPRITQDQVPARREVSSHRGVAEGTNSMADTSSTGTLRSRPSWPIRIVVSSPR
jgi:hypothetical protein